jgi:PEP-CTERM motif
MKFIHSAAQAGLLGAVCLLGAGHGQAVAFVGPALSNCTTLAGTNGLVTVTECAFSGGAGPISYGGTYGVDVSGAKGAREVTTLYVSTNNQAPDGISGNNSSFVSRSGWATYYVSASDWDKAYKSAGWSFGEPFGSDLGVYAYYSLLKNDGYGNTIYQSPLQLDSSINARSLTFGWYGGEPNSHFVALDANGFIVSQSFTSPVPEPSAYALMLAGLGALGVLVRRRRPA